MCAYRTSITIEDPSRVVFSDLPFQAGDRVDVIMEKEYTPKTEIGKKWEKLFEEIDNSTTVRRITEEEIAAEIAAYRAERRAGKR